MTNALLLMSVGITMEVIFTAATSYRKKKDLKLYGETTLWMLPIYVLVYPAFTHLWPTIGAWPWLVRGALYLTVLYTVEYSTGWALRRVTGRCPWDYGRARWAVSGLIRLDYAPAWLIAVFVFERLYLALA